MNPSDEEKSWLNLGVAGQKFEESSGSRPKPINVKVCHFCNRKFYSPQALGGHQNAHKREREAARRYHSLAMQTEYPIHRALGVHSHSYSHPHNKPTTTSETVGEYGDAWVNGGAGVMWPGSFHINSQMASQPSDQLTVDLTLKL